MKKIKVEDSVGYSLFHDVTAMKDGFKGAWFKRGHIIEEKDVEVLLDLGKRYIFVPEDEDKDIHEEECAVRMAKCLEMEGVHFEGPSEGKMDMYCDVNGMFTLNSVVLKKLNSIPDITVTSIPNHFPVKPGDKIMSMRIVPLFTDESNISEFEKVMAGEELARVYEYKELTVGIVITGSEIYTGRIKDRFEPIIRKKLGEFPARISDVSICDDDVEMIKEAAKTFIEKGADILIFSGGMSVDPDDVTPTAIKSLGADIVTYGVPAQPGNMTLISYIGEVAAIGVPGAAVSKPVTVLDVILPQLFCKIKFSKENLVELGDGGLCMSCKSCHFPNCTFGRY